MCNLIGWMGSICFAFCGAPQAIKCIQQKHAKGVSGLFLSLWLMGEVCYIIAVLTEFGFVIWMMFNYLLNLIWISVIFYYWRKNATKQNL